jgi:hypothetical protein
MRHKPHFLLAAIVVMTIASALCAQPYDAAGNLRFPQPRGGIDGPPGTKLAEFRSAAYKTLGVAFAGDTLYQITPVLGGRYGILEVDPTTGASKSTIHLSGLTPRNHPWGLGWDPRRKAFIIADPSTPSILRADQGGKVTTAVNTAPAANVGAAYDSYRDGYWITAWNANTLTLYDATSITPLRTINLAAVGATRAAGTAYSAVNDMVYTTGRNAKKGFVFSASTGALLTSFNLVHRGLNNGTGAAWRDRWQCPLIGDFETIMYTYTDVGLPRIDANATIGIGKSLGVEFESGNSAGKSYAGAASLTERVRGIRFDFGRHFPLIVDDLFFFSLTAPWIFQGFAGTLDAKGTAKGAVNVPSAPVLIGFVFSIAWVTVDSAAPLGIQHVSGPWKVRVTT